METHQKHRIDLNTSKIVIAIAQLTGPFPDGKHKTVINERETLAWKSLDDMRSRTEKVYTILDGLSEVPLKPDIVVFPEYSFPVLRAVPELQQKADRHGFIIVGGADTVWQDSTIIYNQSPIIIPSRQEPIWVTKRKVSQWEEGLVDEPSEAPQPLLVWEADGREFWLSTQVCLDFSLVSDDFKEGGGLFLVPMCSPDVMPFLGWADALLRLPGGTATVLCNCVGEFAKGQSGVVAVNAGGKPFQAAFELSTIKEQVAVFEIDLQHLSPPKKTPTKQKVFPLVRRYLYDLEAMLGGAVQLHELPSPDEGVRKRGVINPGIFSAVLGKKMRMAFLNVPQYAEVQKNVEGKDYEVLAILGKEDLMVTHLADDRYDMIFDVTQAINWIGINNETVTLQNLHELNQDNFPHFRVDTYYKVLGVPVDEEARAAFGSREKPGPNFDDISKIFKLGDRWDHSDVSDEERKRFLANKWILNTTETMPGNINAVMTISLQYARSEIKASLQAKFEEKVVRELLREAQVTSLYRGTSPGLGVDYVLRLSIEVSNDFTSLYDLIEKVHELSLAERLRADTTTYIVVKRLAQLSLSKSILVTKLSRGKWYRDNRIIPHLNKDERVRLTYQPEKEQLDFIDLFRPVDEGVEKINHLGLDPQEKVFFRGKLVGGLLNKDYDSLREVHDKLQARVEKLLSNYIRDYIGEDDFKQLKAKEGIQSQRDRSQLSYSEKIKVVARHVEEGKQRGDFLTAFLGDFINEEDFRQLKDKENVPPQKAKAQLSEAEKAKIVARYIEETGLLSSVGELNSTNKARNAFAHGDAEQRITLEEVTATVVSYCNFIHAWGRT
jgi:hypothetical protein